MSSNISAAAKRAWDRDPERKRKAAACFSDTVKALWADPVYKKKHSEVLKARYYDKVWKAKFIAALKKGMARPEVRAKIRLAARLRWKSAEYRKKLAKPRIIKDCATCGKTFERLASRTKSKYCSVVCLNRGRIRSYHNNPANKEAITLSASRARKIRWADPEQRRLASKQFKELWADAAYKKKTGAAIKVGQQKIWSDPSYREKRIRNFMRAQAQRPTQAEKKLGNILRGLYPKQFKYNGSRAGVVLASHIPDFVSTNGKKQLIEMFGCYWHGCKPCGHDDTIQNQNDTARLKDFRRLGWKPLVVWQHELKNPSRLVKRLTKFIDRVKK